MKLGIIGFGSMASAMADGLIASGALDPTDIYACARNRDKLKKNCEKRGINACDDAADVVAASDVIVIGVHPDQVEKVLAPVAESLRGKLVVSLAAGVTSQMYETFLPTGISHISIIPNTQVKVGEGIIISESDNTITDDDRKVYEDLFSRLGLIEYVDTDKFDLGAAIGGCSTAFAAMMMEALSDAAVKYGLSREAGYRLAGQMMAGAGKYILETGTHPAVLKDQLCTPGGMTIKGVTMLDKLGFRGAITEAIDEIMAED